ncbi:MAG: hydroxymethylbilane synthase [Desulfobulbaceae bacterium]|nr:hydroxymethylbilane synthase [Desulfobulbaceae bacterium]
MTTVKIGSRKSKLAMWQTNTVAGMLNDQGIATEIITMETKGDKILDTSIAKIGSKGVFTEELEDMLASGEIDIAVHSAKDMPSQLPEGFSLIAFTEREHPYDVLVSEDKSINLDDTSRKLKIGTSSVRRVSLLKHFYPHVEAVDMRGNLQTRVKKMKNGDCDALLLAYAGVHRMEYSDMIVAKFPIDKFVPPVGQGCIAIEAGRISEEKKKLVRDCLNNVESETCLLAERAFLKTLEGGCSIPAFALATLNGDTVTLSGGLVSLDGQRQIKHTLTGSGKDAVALGDQLGTKILADGGKELLAEIRQAQG